MYRTFVKRMFDIVLAILALPFYVLILLIIGPIIYLEDRGDIFYNSPRLGKNGTIFVMHKFRSMKLKAPDLRNPDGSTFNADDDPRLTKIGKFIRKTSIDEIPQLLNILKGDMSIVGPRPDLPTHKNLYEGNEHRKLEILPGVTGYNQAYYRNTIPWKERIKNDIYYIDHISFLMDLKILSRTIVSVIKREDIYIKQKSSNKNGEKANV